MGVGVPGVGGVVPGLVTEGVIFSVGTGTDGTVGIGTEGTVGTGVVGVGVAAWHIFQSGDFIAVKHSSRGEC